MSDHHGAVPDHHGAVPDLGQLAQDHHGAVPKLAELRGPIGGNRIPASYLKRFLPADPDRNETLPYDLRLFMDQMK